MVPYMVYSINGCVERLQQSHICKVAFLSRKLISYSTHCRITNLRSFVTFSWTNILELTFYIASV